MTTKPRIARRATILLLDDHSIVREGIRLLLERHPDFEIVAEAGSLEEAQAVEDQPDLIVADLVLGDARGAAIVRAMHELFPASKILVLSMLDNPIDVQQSLAAGASGYVLKEAAASDLVTAIGAVLSGRDYVQPSLGAAVVRHVEDRASGAPGQVSALSKREQEVLQLIALGHTNAEVADLLTIASRTVEAHRGHIQQKLRVRTRAELVRLAVEAGLVEFWRA